MFEKILLAVDGSESALHAARTAASLSNAMNTRTLRVVVAYEPIPPYLGEPDFQRAVNARLTDAQEILRKAVAALGTISAELHADTIEGNPAEAIIEVARTRNIDLIVMGARGLGRLAGLLLGSTSQKVVALAPCPVLIVR